MLSVARVWLESLEAVEFQFFIGDAYLFLTDPPSFAVGEVSILYWRCLSRRGRDCLRARHEFQFSIGDALPGMSVRVVDVKSVSILYWRCTLRRVKRTSTPHVSTVSILYWRCPTDRRDRRVVGSVPQDVSILYWRCGRDGAQSAGRRGS